MSYRDLLRQRRLAAGVPTVPTAPSPVGTEKVLKNKRVPTVPAVPAPIRVRQ